jgi:hypothetical protein
MKRSASRIIPMALFIAGFVLIVIGVLYLITPLDGLPSFLGGIHHGGLHASEAHRTKRADVALFLGILTLIASWWIYARSIPEPQYARRGTPASELGQRLGEPTPTEPTEDVGWHASNETESEEAVRSKTDSGPLA